MTEQITVKINAELLKSLIRTNISCYLTRPLTVEVLEEMTNKIIESIEYFLNKKDV